MAVRFMGKNPHRKVVRQIPNRKFSHRVIVKNTTLLVFNYSNDVHINNLSKKIKLSELEDYLKNIKNLKQIKKWLTID